MTAKRVCSIQGCGRPHYAHGWCRSHYGRWYHDVKLGPEVPIGVRQPPRHGTENMYSNHRCRCQDCRRAHTLAFQEALIRRGQALGPCTNAGCNAPQYARGLCRKCYARQRYAQRKALVNA